jgi:hypothetical protein
VNVIVYRWTAHIEAHIGGTKGLEGFFLAGKCIVERQRLHAVFRKIGHEVTNRGSKHRVEKDTEFWRCIVAKTDSVISYMTCQLCQKSVGPLRLCV